MGGCVQDLGMAALRWRKIILAWFPVLRLILDNVIRIEAI